MTKAEIVEAFRERGYLPGQSEFLDLSTAIEFVNLCEEKDFAICGIECFHYDGELLWPIDIAVFSAGVTNKKLGLRRNEDVFNFFLELSGRKHEGVLLLDINF